MTTPGVDYAGAHPAPAQLKAAGMRFACRYAGPGGTWKHAGKSEIDALRAAGIAIVANAEGAADGLLGGDVAGRSWAIDAEQAWADLGMPPARPIYFSVDFNANATHWARLDDAFRGIAKVIPLARIGVYGGYGTIAHFAQNGLARWFWQTYAWSGGVWHARTHIHQTRNHVTLGSGIVDFDTAMTADYGQWGVATVPSLNPGARAYTYRTITGQYPRLKWGDDDALQGGTRYVTRLQRLLGMAPSEQDGIYGDKTAARVHALPLGAAAPSSTNGRVVDVPEWRKLLGAWL